MAKRVTVNRILDSFSAKSGIKRAYIEMSKNEGTYHFGGKFGAMMSRREMNTHITRLSDWTLDRWIEHLESIVKDEDWQEEDLNKMIESINWNDI